MVLKLLELTLDLEMNLRQLASGIAARSRIGFRTKIDARRRNGFASDNGFE
jgi:hypothetical protein